MLVEVADLKTYMDIKFSNRQTDAAEMVLAGLQSELEAYLRRPLEVQEFENEEHIVDWEHFMLPVSSFFYDTNLDVTNYPRSTLVTPYTVHLRNSPVLSIDNVTVYSRTRDAPMTLVEGLDYVQRRYGVDVLVVLQNEIIEVTYTAGLDGPAIPVFKLLILRAATREMQNMHDDVVGVKDLTARDVAPMTTGFTEQELRSVKRWKRHQL